jgi:hypothetical protein
MGMTPWLVLAIYLAGADLGWHRWRSRGQFRYACSTAADTGAALLWPLGVAVGAIFLLAELVGKAATR